MPVLKGMVLVTFILLLEPLLHLILLFFFFFVISAALTSESNTLTCTIHAAVS